MESKVDLCRANTGTSLGLILQVKLILRGILRLINSVNLSRERRSGLERQLTRQSHHERGLAFKPAISK